MEAAQLRWLDDDPRSMEVPLLKHVLCCPCDVPVMKVEGPCLSAIQPFSALDQHNPECNDKVSNCVRSLFSYLFEKFKGFMCHDKGYGKWFLEW